MTKFSKKTPKTSRICDFAGCDEPGEYKAPKDKNLTSHYWFCLKHVREYNKNWDFYAGLTPEEIEKHLQNDITWQRPTWKLGQMPGDRGMKDTFGLFCEETLGMNGRHNPPTAKPPVPDNISAALDFMELSLPLALSDLKKQYKKLAKKYHPDTNKNDDAGRRFHTLTQSYQILVDYLKKGF